MRYLILLVILSLVATPIFAAEETEGKSDLEKDILAKVNTFLGLIPNNILSDADKASHRADIEREAKKLARCK